MATLTLTVKGDTLRKTGELAGADRAESEKARRNAEYLEKIDRSMRQIEEGKVVIKTMEELEGMAT